MNYVLIPISNGKAFAKVDPEDAQLLSSRKWYLLEQDGHRRYAVANKGVGMHRIVMQAKSGQQLDHIDGDGLNNTKRNLRFANTSENAFNARLSKRNKSGVKGVHQFKVGNRYYWECNITANGKRHRAVRADFGEAVTWITNKRIELHGQFANMGKHQ